MRNHSFTTTTEFNMGNPHTLMRSDAEQAARMMWSGCYTKGKNMAHAVVFAEHTVKGMRDPWYIDEHSGAEYVRTWDDALRILDDGTPKKVVLYPNAECQVLDNSKEFYKR